MRERVTFKGGETYHLDTVYKWLGLLLHEEDYDQDDPNDEDGDSGESVRFLRTVHIDVRITRNGSPS